jgi:hypothetical protein
MTTMGNDLDTPVSDYSDAPGQRPNHPFSQLGLAVGGFLTVFAAEAVDCLIVLGAGLPRYSYYVVGVTGFLLMVLFWNKIVRRRGTWLTTICMVAVLSGFSWIAAQHVSAIASNLLYDFFRR